MLLHELCDVESLVRLPLFLEHRELATQDIVSYSFGDMDALYLRGQWTVHRNRRDVSTIWKACPHLGAELQKELLMKVAWVRRMESRGAGEILLTSMNRDGTQSGFDLELTRTIADSVSIPVIASGGVGTLDHLVDGVIKGHASAVLAASIFHFGAYSIAQAKTHMQNAGVAVRPSSEPNHD